MSDKPSPIRPLLNQNQEASRADTDIVTQPQIVALRIDVRVPREELREADALGIVDDIAAVARLDESEPLAAADDAGHLRLRARGCLCRQCPGRCGAGNADADVVVEPQVITVCLRKKSVYGSPVI